MAEVHETEEEEYGSDDDIFYSVPRPYLFEPQYSPTEIERRRKEKNNSAVAPLPTALVSRLNDSFWCTCGFCTPMATEDECVCCNEVQQTLSLLERERPTTTPMEKDDDLLLRCITSHCDLEAHLNTSVLTTFFRSHRHNWKQFPKPRGLHGQLNNEQYRLVAYRVVLQWILQGEKLGYKNRMVLPACLVKKIREKFPSPDGTYKGFSWPATDDA
ncbi:uncharacterized protein [Antedon mediterranea]|uniref:uncharacterized protein n=1 Tax=Antedon mediterranea TaxID=105859 RepID=UPI003AF9867A